MNQQIIESLGFDQIERRGSPMASAKSSRSRALAPPGVIASGFQQPSVQESGVQLVDKLKIFKTDNFDFDAYVQSKCQTINEKEIRHLCSYLQELKKEGFS